jgi:8-oxo-dGTP pyrophosphatase MutT (NUDIX family)
MLPPPPLKKCYLLPVHLLPKRVLLGKKNIEAKRIGGIPQFFPYKTWNYPGQWVISGGEQKPGESELQAACREFFEETNVDLTSALVKSKAISEAKYYCVAARINPTRVDELATMINNNIAGSLVRDDELDKVEWFHIDDAILKMGSIVSPMLYPQSYEPRDWFVNILTVVKSWM